MTIVFFLDIYYCIIICWTLFYLINSFVAIPDLPWGSCGNSKSQKFFIFRNHSFDIRILSYLISTFISYLNLGNWWNTVNCYDPDHLNKTGVTATVGDNGENKNPVEQLVKHNNSKSPVEEYWE